jgi:2-dehydro-3-deoxyphosphogluconate aldolase/(4S)-4-hydroxy-2-oxoglutarate aldolase
MGLGGIIMNELQKKISEIGIVPVIKLNNPQRDAKPLADALCAGGVPVAEVTFRAAGAAEAIAIMRQAHPEMLVGAGTVTTPALVDMAAEAGAAYIISPDTDEEVIRRTRELGLVSLPGAYTPTEAKKAHNAGADFVKLFPCVGDAPAYLKALCAPLNHIRFLAVGGVTADNATDFLKAGAVGLGVGGSLVNKKWVHAGEYSRITEEAKRFVQNIK